MYIHIRHYPFKFQQAFGLLYGIINIFTQNISVRLTAVFMYPMRIFFDAVKFRTVPSQQKWTPKSFKKRNESQYFVNLLKSTALFHGLLAGDLCRHDVPAKERSSPRAIRPGTSLSYRLLIVKQLSRHKC